VLASDGGVSGAVKKPLEITPRPGADTVHATSAFQGLLRTRGRWPTVKKKKGTATNFTTTCIYTLMNYYYYYYHYIIHKRNRTARARVIIKPSCVTRDARTTPRKRLIITTLTTAVDILRAYSRVIRLRLRTCAPGARWSITSNDASVSTARSLRAFSLGDRLTIRKFWILSTDVGYRKWVDKNGLRNG
jgi:hypothetical protein